MKRFVSVVVSIVFVVSGFANADVWRWNDNFIAAFVDAEGINRHPGSSEQGEQFEGQMLDTLDVVGPGVDVYYDLVDTIGDPVDNSVAGLEVWKPNGADWLGQGATSGLGLVTQWGKQLHMDASGLDSLELPLWYKSGQGPLDVRVFCVTGTSSGDWIETQMDSATVTLNQGESAILTVDLTVAPDPTRMVKVGVVIEAHDSTMLGEKATLHIGSVPVATMMLENYGPNSSYRWMDVANQTYSVAFQNSYTYDDANVQVTYNTVGQQLVGTLTATNLKPNFAYQFKLIGESTYKPGDANDGCNELIGLNGRWWEQEWTGSSWNAGWNLNNKGDGSSPNPNDNTYYARRNTADSGSPTGLNYKYTGYRVFEYFITDENGNASLSYTVNNCYHVLFKTTQATTGANDGPVVTRTFNVNPSIHTQYDIDYPQQTVSIFGEWERLPKNGVGLRLGDYTCYMLLTEESFHGSGLQGWWAHAMKGQVQFTVVSLGQPVVPNVVGMTQAAATTAITAVDNLTVGTVTQQYSNTVAAGLVISQSPAGGTAVPTGSSVNLVVSLGRPVVPNVVGMTQAAATAAITAVDNLTIGTVTQQYSDTVAVGLVISQSPAGGTAVAINSTVSIVVSLGQPVVPNVVGMTQAAAESAITAVDSLTANVSTAYSNTIAAGLVISQSPAGGTAVAIGSTVSIVVSLGQPVVPNVVGMTQAAATTAITAVDNLTIGTVTQQYSDTVAAGLVISQSPAGGTAVPIGSSVNLVVSLGQPVVPNVVGMTQAAATTAITAVDNLTVGTVTKQYSNTIAAGLVISQSPQGNTIVPIKSSVDIIVSLGPPPAAIYVDDDAEGDLGPHDPNVSDPLEDGSANHPFDMIQEAIEVSMEGLTIIVIEGAYYENIDFGGRNIALCSADPNDPNVVANTIIDGIRVGTVVTFVETANCLLTGFTITGGNAEFGGGIYCYNSSPTISKCVISGNWADHGGGIYNHQSSPTLANCIFSGNRAIHYGGGMYNVDSSGTAVLTNCTLSGNSANSGGGIYNQSSYLLLTNSILWGNDDKGGTDESVQIDVNNNSVALVNYSCVQGWTGALGGIGSFDADPCFAELGYWDDNATPMDVNDDVWVNGDYHLRSEDGRWVPNQNDWVYDAATSPCIDAGDPNSDWTAELWPNGKRINMGAYGGTDQASMNGNAADFNIDGVVDFEDFSELASRWIHKGIFIQELTGDRIVDSADLRVFVENWLWRASWYEH